VKNNAERGIKKEDDGDLKKRVEKVFWAKGVKEYAKRGLRKMGEWLRDRDMCS
jgi:hypothetical protein